MSRLRVRDPLGEEPRKPWNGSELGTKEQGSQGSPAGFSAGEREVGLGAGFLFWFCGSAHRAQDREEPKP